MGCEGGNCEVSELLTKNICLGLFAFGKFPRFLTGIAGGIIRSLNAKLFFAVMPQISAIVLPISSRVPSIFVAVLKYSGGVL